MKAYSVLAAGLVLANSSTEGLDQHHQSDYIPPKARRANNNVFGQHQQQQHRVGNVFAAKPQHDDGQGTMQVCQQQLKQIEILQSMFV